MANGLARRGVKRKPLGGTGLRFQKGDSFQLAEVWVSVCLFAYGPKALGKNSKLAVFATAKDILKYLNVALRQPLSSLLSKQSGNPLHCHPPGTHFPSAHMKFPGMLHSVVALLPGSSWLSDGEEENRLLRLYTSKNRNAAFIPTARMTDG